MLPNLIKKTGQVRLWTECYDQQGNVNRIHPKMIDGQQVYAQHYPLTQAELSSFTKKPGWPHETTLSSRILIKFLSDCKKIGYQVNILFLWLHSPGLAIRRVKSRVAQGGHNIEKNVIVRRYYRSIDNFFNKYMEISDNWFLYDNSETESNLIASKTSNKINIVDAVLWDNIKLGIKK